MPNLNSESIDQPVQPGRNPNLFACYSDSAEIYLFTKSEGYQAIFFYFFFFISSQNIHCLFFELHIFMKTQKENYQWFLPAQNAFPDNKTKPS